MCTSRFTKCCARHEICTSRFTKCRACHEICTSRFTKCCACEVHKVLCMTRNLHFEVHKVLCLSRNLHFEVHSLPRKLHEMCTSRFTKCCACHEICKRATCPKATIHCTCHKIRAPRGSRPYAKCCTCHKFYTSEQSPIPCTCQEKSTLEYVGPPNLKHELSLAPATKSDHHVQKRVRHHNESAVATSTHCGHPDFASLHSRIARRRFREAYMYCK